MRAFEFLLEDRVDYLAQQMGDKVMSAYEADNGTKPKLDNPTGVLRYLEQASKKDINWIARNYINKKFKLEDISKIKQEIDLFNKIKSKLPADQRDLNKLSLSQLYDITDKYQETDITSNKEQQRQEKEKFYSPDESEVLYKSKDLIVLIPKTEEASCYFGKGTKWCTAATDSRNYFDEYSNQGPLYIIMTKDMGKFQFQFESNQFMNSRDEQIKPEQIHKLTSKYPELYKIFEKPAIKHLYLPLIKNPSSEVQLAAVNEDGYAIEYIKNPSSEVQLAAVNEDGFAIEYIKDPSEEVQLAAVNKNGFAIEYIKDPSEEVQLAAVNKNGRVIYHIQNPSPKVKELAEKLKNEK